MIIFKAHDHATNLLFKKFYLLIFKDRGRERDREGEKYQCEVDSHVAPTGDLAHNPGVCPDWESNQRPFDSQPALYPLSYTSQSVTYKFKNKTCGARKENHANRQGSWDQVRRPRGRGETHQPTMRIPRPPTVLPQWGAQKADDNSQSPDRGAKDLLTGLPPAW